MSQGLITNTYLSDLADAIRTKLDTVKTYRPDQMAFAILKIGGFPEDFVVPFPSLASIEDTPDPEGDVTFEYMSQYGTRAQYNSKWPSDGLFLAVHKPVYYFSYQYSSSGKSIVYVSSIQQSIYTTSWQGTVGTASLNQQTADGLYYGIPGNNVYPVNGIPHYQTLAAGLAAVTPYLTED